MKITTANIRAWSMLGQRGAIFGVGILDLGKELEHFKVLSADLSLLSGMDRFIKKYPEKKISTSSGIIKYDVSVTDIIINILIIPKAINNS